MPQHICEDKPLSDQPGHQMPKTTTTVSIFVEDWTHISSYEDWTIPRYLVQINLQKQSTDKNHARQPPGSDL